MAGRWVVLTLVVLCGSGCLAERASPADLKAAARKAKPTDVALDAADGVDATAGSADAWDSAATVTDVEETSGDVAASEVWDTATPDATVVAVGDADPDMASQDAGEPAPDSGATEDADIADSAASEVDGAGGDSGGDTATCPDGMPCSDGNPCTVGDACSGGKCAGGQNNCSCTQTSDCVGKEDGDLCNGTLFCDKSAVPYGCKVDPTTVKTCDASKDGPCEKTACVASSGLCVKAGANEAKACDADGSVCTVGDACKGGVCLAGGVTGCDDGNGCTADGCDPAKGCTHTAVTDGTVCASGNCAAGLCKPVAAVKSWPFGTDGDLVSTAANVVTLDADSREPPIWDFAKCNIGGTVKIVGKRSWVFIGCAGDMVLDGTIDVQAGHDIADYKDSQEPDLAGKLTGAKLKRGSYVQVGATGAGWGTCDSGKGGPQLQGNGGGGGGGKGTSGGTTSCGIGGQDGTSGGGGQGGKGGSPMGGSGGKGGTAAVPAEPGNTAGQNYAGGGGGGGGFRGMAAASLYLRVAGNVSGVGLIQATGKPGQPGGAGGKNGNMGGVAGNGGGGGAGGAGGGLVLRVGGTVSVSLATQVSLAGGAPGSGGTSAQSGPPGSVDHAYLANPGGFGGTCGPANPCDKSLSCQPISAKGLCTTPVCAADAECQFGQAPLGKCITLAAAALNGAKRCYPPCGATMACGRSDFTCDLAKGACIPDCRVQSDGFCPDFKTCDAKTGLCADVTCSGTCSAGNICWNNPCNKQVCTPDCTAAVVKACTFDIDCASGICLAGQCAACPKGSKCQAISKVCVPDGGAPACVP